MPNQESCGWLEAVLIQARDAGWCTEPVCTTCGGMEFRRAYWAAAAARAGITGRFESARLPREIFDGVSNTDRAEMVHALVAGLRELSPAWADSDALRTIIMELYPPLIRHGVGVNLRAELTGTAAGEAYAEVRADAKADWEAAKQRRAYESPEAVEARRQIKRDIRAAAHSQRQSEKRQKDLGRLQLLHKLARLSPAERLACFATDPGLVLDCVPAELIPNQELDAVDIDKARAAALLTRIGRRRGAWGRLRGILENRVNSS